MSTVTPSDTGEPALTESSARASKLGRLGPVLSLAHLSWMMPVAASSPLLQALLGTMDAHTKLSRFAILAAVGAIVGMLANVLFGVLSDRTRSRFGRRNPWILVGGFGAAASMSALSLTRSFPLMVGLWICFQIALNAMVGPLVAVLADRVADRQLGRASSWIGVGQLLGQGVGTVAAGLVVASPPLGLRWIPWAMALGALAVFCGAPDRSSARRDGPGGQASTRQADPARPLLPRDADFLWALGGRLLTMLGLQCVLVYQLYVLTDYVGLSTKGAGGAIATSGVLIAFLSAAAIGVSGPLSDRLGRRKVFVIAAAVLVALAMIPPLVSPTLPAFYAFVVIGGLAYGTYIAVDQALMAEVLPDAQHRAKDMGLLNSANTIPQVLAPLIAVALVPALGYRVLFVLGIALSLGGALCIAAIRRVR
jgi:MFS family permease